MGCGFDLPSHSDFGRRALRFCLPNELSHGGTTCRITAFEEAFDGRSIVNLDCYQQCP